MPPSRYVRNYRFEKNAQFVSTKITELGTLLCVMKRGKSNRLFSGCIRLSDSMSGKCNQALIDQMAFHRRQVTLRRLIPTHSFSYVLKLYPSNHTHTYYVDSPRIFTWIYTGSFKVKLSFWYVYTCLMVALKGLINYIYVYLSGLYRFLFSRSPVI